MAKKYPAEDCGVVIIERGRCTFASSLITLDEAEQLVARLAGAQIVTAKVLRVWKRSMLTKS